MLLPNKFYSDDLFNELFRTNQNNNAKCDVYSTNDNYFIEVEIPGYKKDDIKIEVDNGYLTITADKNETVYNDNDKNYIHKERNYNKITRSFNFGNINISDITAKFEDGLLIITIPKDKEIETKKYINID